MMEEVRRKKVEKNKKHKIIGMSIAGLQLIASAVLVILVMRLDVLPNKYLLPVIAVLLLLVAGVCAMQFFKKAWLAGWIISGLLCVILIIGNVYMIRTYMLMNSITVEDDENYKVDNIVVAVLKDDRAQSMDDALLYNFGIQKTQDRQNTDATITEIEQQSGTPLTITEFDDFSTMADALYNGSIQAIIYNAAYNDTIEEVVSSFTDKIRVLNSHEIRTKLNLTASDMNVAKEPFTVYISGIDVYGDISKTSRSDVNMLVTVNPITKEIIMTTTPRDYYVTLPNVSGDYRDKLTHAGIYGIECSMDTLSSIYDVDIDYYVRVNFTTLKKLVDALGGVDVYSEHAFTTHYKNGGYEIKKGYNHMNGKVALAFSRERYNVPGGDEQRGKDQQAVLTALIKKAMSPSILTGYMGIMDSLDGSFETNMSMNQIASLVKMQLGDGASWTIVSQSVTGSFGNEYCYSGGNMRLSVMYPDAISIQKARNEILKVLGREDEIESESSMDTQIETGSVFDSNESGFESFGESAGESEIVYGIKINES